MKAEDLVKKEEEEQKDKAETKINEQQLQWASADSSIHFSKWWPAMFVVFMIILRAKIATPPPIAIKAVIRQGRYM